MISFLFYLSFFLINFSVRAEWSLELEGELLSLVDEVPPKHYTRLCNALGVKHARSKAILSENLLDVSNSLFEVICSWGVKQRNGTNYKTLVAEKLRSVHLDALGTKLVEGECAVQFISVFSRDCLSLVYV